MARRALVGCVCLALLVIAFWLGRAGGLKSAAKAQVSRDVELVRELLELDRSILAKVSVRPSSMSSGLYRLEVQFTGSPSQVTEIELEVANGKLVRLGSQSAQEVVQTGNVVSWQQIDMDERPSRQFVGLVDGSEMWGKVYVGPGQGWREGEPAAYGVWRIYR